MTCSLFACWLYSLNYLSYEDVIYGTSSLCSFSCVSNGVGIYGISAIYLTTCTIVGIAYGSILPLIIFYALNSMLSCSLFTLEPKVLPSSTLFFLLRALLKKSTAILFLSSNVVYISSLVLSTLVNNFYGISF